MHHGVGAAAQRVQQCDGIIKGLGGQNLRGTDIRFDQFDDLPAGGLRQARPARIGRGDGAVARQRDAQRFHQRIHRRGRAHDHAVPGAAHKVLFDCLVSLGSDGTGLVLGGVAPAIGASAQDLAIVMAVEHGTAAEHDGRDIGAGGAHQRGGCGLVAIGQQHDAIQRIAADHLFGVHRRQIAIEHGSRAEVDFTQRDGGEFQRGSRPLAAHRV